MTAGVLVSPVLGRIVRPADYVRVLATPMRLRSPHFAVHHLVGRPLPLKRALPRDRLAGAGASEPAAADATGHAPVTASLSTELSTAPPIAAVQGVDDSPAAVSGELVETRTNERWLGLVVPKRHARRAVTRTLLKRQIRHVAAAVAPSLEPGLWVVRQRLPFDPKQFPSAASEALKEAARAELRALFERAVRGERDRIKPRPPGETFAKGKSDKNKPARPSAPEAPPCAS